MKKSIWILSGIGALLLAILSIQCAHDMIYRIENGIPYTINLYFHPISAVISVVLLGIFLYPLSQRYLKHGN